MWVPPAYPGMKTDKAQSKFKVELHLSNGRLACRATVRRARAPERQPRRIFGPTRTSTSWGCRPAMTCATLCGIVLPIYRDRVRQTRQPAAQLALTSPQVGPPQIPSLSWQCLWSGGKRPQRDGPLIESRPARDEGSAAASEDVLMSSQYHSDSNGNVGGGLPEGFRSRPGWQELWDEGSAAGWLAPAQDVGDVCLRFTHFTHLCLDPQYTVFPCSA